MSERVPAGGAYKAAVGLHEPLSVEHLRSARSMLSIYCRRSGPFCSKYLSLARRASLLVAKARIGDLSGDAKYSGVDEELLKLYEGLVEVYASVLSGLLVSIGEYVMVRAKATVIGGGVDLVEGEVTLLPLGKAASLYLAGVVEPVASLAVENAQGE